MTFKTREKLQQNIRQRNFLHTLLIPGILRHIQHYESVRACSHQGYRVSSIGARRRVVEWCKAQSERIKDNQGMSLEPFPNSYGSMVRASASASPSPSLGWTWLDLVNCVGSEKNDGLGNCVSA